MLHSEVCLWSNFFFSPTSVVDGSWFHRFIRLANVLTTVSKKSLYCAYGTTGDIEKKGVSYFASTPIFRSLEPYFYCIFGGSHSHGTSEVSEMYVKVNQIKRAMVTGTNDGYKMITRYPKRNGSCARHQFDRQRPQCRDKTKTKGFYCSIQCSHSFVMGSGGRGPI